MNTIVSRASGSTAYQDPYAPPQPNAPDRLHAARAVAVNGFEPEAVAEPRRRMQRAGLVRRHQLDGARREDADAVERALVPDHLQEAGVVAGRGQQAGAAGETAPRSVHVGALPAAAFRSADDRAIAAAGVDSRQPVTGARRQEEHGVFQAERPRDFLPDELVERHPRRAFHDTAQDVDVVAVDPRFARLRDERQRRQPLHRRADRLVLVGGIPAEPSGRAKRFRFVL